MKRDEALRVLGLGANATAAEIRDRFRKRVKEVHPDLAGPNKATEFVFVYSAYASLCGSQAAAAEQSSDDPQLELMIRECLDRALKSLKEVRRDVENTLDDLEFWLASSIDGSATARDLRMLIEKEYPKRISLIRQTVHSIRDRIVGSTIDESLRWLDGLWSSMLREAYSKARPGAVSVVIRWLLTAGASTAGVLLTARYLDTTLISEQPRMIAGAGIGLIAGYLILFLIPWLIRRQVLALPSSWLAPKAGSSLVPLESSMGSVEQSQGEIRVAALGVAGMTGWVTGDPWIGGAIALIGLLLGGKSLDELKAEVHQRASKHLERLKYETIRSLDDFEAKLEGLVRAHVTKNWRLSLQRATRFVPLLLEEPRNDPPQLAAS